MNDDVVPEDNGNLIEATQPEVTCWLDPASIPREDPAEAATVAGNDAPMIGGARRVVEIFASWPDMPDIPDVADVASWEGAEMAPVLADPQACAAAAMTGMSPRLAEARGNLGEPFTRRDAVSQQSASVMLGYDTTRAVDSHHLRAARALLGWAMSDLARFSGLSLSTIRRLEQSAQTVSMRNHQAAVDALRMGGIRFLTLDDGTTALAELGHMPALLRIGSPRGDSSPR